MKRTAALALSLILVTGMFAQEAPAKKKKAAKSSPDAVTTQLQEMKRALENQEQQIQQLKQAIQQRDQALQQVQQQLGQTQQTASEAQAKAESAVETAKPVPALQTDVSDLKNNATTTALNLQESQKRMGEMESPMAIHFKGVTLTPGGFAAAETVWRSRAEGADINTSFNGIPMPGASQSRISEFFPSGRQSRLSLLAEGKLKGAKLTGFFEADFLSAGVTSNNNQSNSYTFRQRQLWGQAAMDNGWTFTGGQMWSLITETRKGLDNRAEALPMAIDPQYTVGFSWARQYGARITKNINNKLWLGFAVEAPQTTLTAHGNAQNFVIGSAGASGGLYNPSATYAFNPAPDLVFKAALEPGWGHFELFGVVSQFRDRIFPCATTAAAATCGGVTGPSSALATNKGSASGGIGANARGSLFNKHVDIGLHIFGGQGVGRYGTSGLADATVRPDGTLALIRSYQALGTLEYHNPKWDVYMNAGGEYAGRYSFLNSAGKPVGYGSVLFSNAGCFTETVPGTPVGGQFPTSSTGFLPGGLASCTADTRNVIEGTFGFWYKIYNGPKGKVQFGPQYSYVVRNTWSGVGGQPHGIENMFFTSFRYYLP